MANGLMYNKSEETTEKNHGVLSCGIAMQQVLKVKYTSYI